MATTTPQTTASPIDRHAAPTADTATRSGKATAALVLGIVSVVAALIPILGLILGVIAVALGAQGRTSGKTNRWAGTAGLILGAIAIAASIGMFIANVALMS